MKCYVIILVVLLCNVSFAAKAGQLSITSLNIGAGIKGKNFGGTCTANQNFGNDYDDTIVGLRRYLGQLAVDNYVSGSDHSLFLLQEVDNNTDRNPGWDMPTYFANRLNQYMVSNGIGTGVWDWNPPHFTGVSSYGGHYGVATLSSAPLQKWTSRTYNGSFADNEVYQSVKVKVDNEWFWVINTHFTSNGGPGQALQQVEEVLDYVAGLDSVVNVVVAGDFNILRDGYHKNICPVPPAVAQEEEPYVGFCEDHANTYVQMKAALQLAEFDEVGSFEGACWETNNNTCSFKASGTSFSRLDYVYLKRANSTITASLELDRPFVDEGCLLTDHFGLNATLNW
jgi:endonuclease/exonuclease/phosphatase family metal-dependent hydrolase